MAAEFSIIGKSVTRIDARPKVTGEAKFTVDMQLPRMLHMKVLRSPYPSARIKNIETSKAESLTGVAAIVTHLDFNGKKQGFGGTPGVVYDDKMRYVGEAAVAVAAENVDIAEEAAKLIKVDYEVLPAIFDIEEAMKPDAIKVHPGGNIATTISPNTVGPSFHWQIGDVEQGFKDAYRTVERKIKTHSQYHSPHEGLSCVMSWEPAAGKLTAWVSGQDPFDVRQSLADLLNLSFANTRVISPYIGGGHGIKGASAVFKEWQMAALLSKKAGRPVKYGQTREECATTTVRRGAAVFNWKVGAKQDGTITAIQVSAAREAGAYGSSIMYLARAVVDYVVTGNFRCPNISEDSNCVFTNTGNTGAYRGFGYFEGNVSFAQLIDELIESLGMDPVDFHLKNIFKAGELVGSTQQPLSSSALDLGIQACAEKISWKEKWHKPGTQTMLNGKKHGIGFGICVGMAFRAPVNKIGSVVKIDSDGKARVFVGATEIGQGQSTGQVQIAAETLGIPFENMSITFSDTENTPWSQPQTASSSTVCCGWPTLLAAQDAKQQLLQAAAANLNKAVDELDTKDGLVFVKTDPKTSITFASAMKGMVNTIIGHGSWSNNGATDPAFRQPNACMCEVEVDTETGLVDITNLVVAVDCGRAISPQRVECQFQSILSGGRGYVLAEEPVLDSETGRILNPSWLDYKISTTLDTGPGIMQPVIIVDSVDPLGPFGAKGAGEAGIVPSAGALLNAIYNAIAVRPNRTPVTPDVILRALGKI